MSKGSNLFIKKANARKIKAFPELNALGICWGASLVIAVILLMSDWDASLEYLWFGGSVETRGMFAFGGSFIMAVAYLAPAVLSIVLTKIAKKRIVTRGEIPLWIRRAGIVLIPFIFTGNLFAAIAGFSLAKKDKTVEYSLGYYAFLNGLFVIIISLLNLFKPTVNEKFWLGIALLGVTLAIYLAAIGLLIRAQKNGGYNKLAPLAAVLILTTISGNLFALILGMVILAKIKNTGNNKSIEWVDTIRRIYRNYMAVLGMFIIILLISLSICSYFTFDYDMAVSNDYSSLMHQPSLRFPFGADHLGRCVFSRIIFGARYSLLVGAAATAIPLILGGLLGAMAGHYSNKTDNVIMRGLDIIYAIPSTLLAIVIIAAFGSGLTNLIIALSISNIPVYARTMRAQVMVVSQNEFVEASRACGRREHETLLRHIIPNSLAPMIVRASVSIGIAVLSTASLSFLGIGLPPHIPEWGNILGAARGYLSTDPHLAIYPGIFIVVLVLAFNFLGDGLRDALDPKLK